MEITALPISNLKRIKSNETHQHHQKTKTKFTHTECIS